MILKHACSILDIEVPDCHLLSNTEKALLLEDVKKQYQALLKAAHPGENGGISPAHNRTIALNDAFKFIQALLSRRRLTITEFYAQYEDKKRQRQKEWKFPVALKGRPKRVFQYSRDGKLIKEWPSLKIAGASLGLHFTAISKSAHRYRGQYTAGGYVWQFMKK